MLEFERTLLPVAVVAYEKPPRGALSYDTLIGERKISGILYTPAMSHAVPPNGCEVKIWIPKQGFSDRPQEVLLQAQRTLTEHFSFYRSATGRRITIEWDTTLIPGDKYAMSTGRVVHPGQPITPVSVVTGEAITLGTTQDLGPITERIGDLEYVLIQIRDTLHESLGEDGAQAHNLERLIEILQNALGPDEETSVQAGIQDLLTEIRNLLTTSDGEQAAGVLQQIATALSGVEVGSIALDDMAKIAIQDIERLEAEIEGLKREHAGQTKNQEKDGPIAKGLSQLLKICGLVLLNRQMARLIQTHSRMDTDSTAAQMLESQIEKLEQRISNLRTNDNT